MTMCSSFELVFLDMVRLLIDETNRYANRDMLDFAVSMEEMMNFIGLLFVSGYNMRTSERMERIF